MFDSRDSVDPIITNNTDIRAVMDTHFFGATAKHGHYMIYRRFDTSQYTEYWDPEKEEAVGGPKYEYTDEIIKVRYSWFYRTRDPEEPIAMGEAAFKEPVLHCRYSVNPKIEDAVFEMKAQPADGYNHSISISDIKLRYDIVQVIPYRNLNGRIEYYSCILKEELL